MYQFSDELKTFLNMSKPKIVFASATAAENVATVCEKLKFVEKVVLFGKSLGEATELDKLVQEGADDINEFEIEKCDPVKTTALILLSSGTTGLPKGVRLSHENVKVPLISLK